MGWSDDYLEHHGILGQKWGVRRFETASGKLTPAGKNRYNSIDGKYQKVKKIASALSNPSGNVKGGPVKDNIERGNKLRLKYGKKTTFENNQEYIKPVKDASKKANDSDEKTTEKKGLSEKQKKILITGAAVAGTALAAYGGYKLYQLNKQATEGLSNDYHKKATVKFTEANKLFAESEGNHSLGFKTYNNDLIKKSVEQNYKGHEKRAEAEALQDIAKSKKFSVGEKAAYLKQQNKLASEASSLAKSVTAEGPKSFSRASQNASQVKSQMTQQKLQAAQRAVSSGNRSVSSTIRVSGQTTFSQASRANDDLVNQMLRRNASMLAGF